MWSYYGSKSKVIDFYPPPKYSKVIESFAGSARYALKFFDRDVLLVDKYEVIVRIWKWLQVASEKDITSLPVLKQGSKINRSDFDCIEQAWLMGFIVNQGVSSPRVTVTMYADEANQKSQKRNIASQLFKIKHWKIELGNYEDIPNQDATWFIDPPYQFGGEYYVKNNRNLDYQSLGEWCKSRAGHVIVCENTKANWLPFKAMRELNGSLHKTVEAIYSNFPTAYDSQQLSLFGAGQANTACTRQGVGSARGDNNQGFTPCG